ncbi:MAG: peptidase M1 [Cyclobacteriaceae bacterium]|nr:peptidase M1 [Cyclobacteriaceae bacterium]
MKISSIIFCVLLLVNCSPKKEIIPGTSLELAIERKNTISNLQYALFFDIPENQKDSIPATVTIRFDLNKLSDVLQLDFNASPENIKKIRVNDQDIKINIENEHILIDKKFLKDNANAINIDFIAGEKALNRNPDYLYTLFVPSRAASCFPVFDQPDLKAIYHLELSIPMTWHALSNGSVLSIDSSTNKKRYSFSNTLATSTYQFAFTAGKFFRAYDPEANMTIYYRETDTAKVSRNLPQIFEMHREAIAWLKDYTGIDYPYEKFDFALMPAFQFGGMEHPGSIFYRERSLFLEPSASINEQLGRASLIAHETAHMWFGNLVTMKWFNDVWLKEVFANFMAAKIVNPAFYQIDHELRFLMAHYPAAYAIDRSQGSHPIQQPLDNLKNAGSVYGAIIYQKAPIMMRNLESLMGEEDFKKGLQEYLKTYSYQNATWDDLVNVLKKHTSKDLEVWNKAWIKTKGMPEITYALSSYNKTVEMKVVNDSSGITWPQFFNVEYKDSKIRFVKEVEIKRDSITRIANADGDDFTVIPNYLGRGYGYFRAPEKDIQYMLSYVETLKDPEARAGIWMNVWEYVLNGELDPKLTLQKLLIALKSERDPLLLDYLTDKIGVIFWQLLTSPQREMINHTLDETLFEQIAIEKDNSLKRIFFNCYRNVATSPEAVANLKKLWKDEITLGLELSERDHILLAYELAVREEKDHQAILTEQLEKISNPDRKKEMEFIMPSLSADASVRDNFFESLKHKENRTHEPWVLEAQRYLNHPLRGNYSVKYVAPSLELLEEMQQTGDIFFPKGWLDATLGEYQTKEAAQSVRDYLMRHKDLRQDLKNKLLQSTDMLFRAESILKKNQVDTPR